MTVTEKKDVHFICDLRMKSEIACAHTVALTASPYLVIDNAGVVASTLMYGFDAGAGLVKKDVGVIGTRCGRGKLFADITSPYFVTPNGLKVKRDTINLTIECEEADGWYGNKQGTHRAGLLSGTGAQGTLYYRYTNKVIGGVGSISSTRTEPAQTELVVRIIKPNGAVVIATSVALDQIGVYQFYPMQAFVYTRGPAALLGTAPYKLGTTTFIANMRAEPPAPITKPSTGLINESSRSIPIPNTPPPNVNINETFTAHEFWAPGTILAAGPITVDGSLTVTKSYLGQNVDVVYGGHLSTSQNPGGWEAQGGLTVNGVSVYQNGAGVFLAVTTP